MSISTTKATDLAYAPSVLLPVVVKTDEQEVSDFAADLNAALHDLEKAFQGRNEVGEKLNELKKKLDGKGWWSTFTSSFNGEIEKDLATMVQGLGSSLGLTQSAVRVMLKVQTQKNRLLYSFNDALVEKIYKIQGDTHTLDDNQKQAALAFLGELQVQVNEQIRQQSLVENHDSQLREIARWQQDKDEDGAVLAGRVLELEAEQSVLERRLVILETENKQARSFTSIIARNLLSTLAFLVGVVALFLAMKA
ncbi:TPA: hypothetical protein UMV36_003930 [Stenotrophomonas maltophilia]|nr:hypothetical protein [Stenotrophomonas maltophilia]MBH1711308.1 hypothetical protein [Stenotrophomonas maltophilia]HEL3759490.1 hypothetical protein [Stenotrophomonas maltophilia]